MVRLNKREEERKRNRECTHRRCLVCKYIRLLAFQLQKYEVSNKAMRPRVKLSAHRKGTAEETRGTIFDFVQFARILFAKRIQLNFFVFDHITSEFKYLNPLLKVAFCSKKKYFFAVMYK